MKDLKNTEAPSNTTTIDKNLVDGPTNNIYEAISIISKRAVQINEETLSKLIDFNKKQIYLSFTSVKKTRYLN